MDIKTRDTNICMFDGTIIATPKYSDEPRPMLEIVLDNAPSLRTSQTVRIHIHALDTLAQLMFPQLAKGDKIHFIGYYSPLKLYETENTIIPRFLANKIIITEKKLSPIQLLYQDTSE